MKGSKHSRQVLKNYNDITTESSIRQTLKDLDFLEIEKSIKMTGQQHSELLLNLKKDVEFFRGLQIIDFSIILSVVKVNDFEGKEGDETPGYKLSSKGLPNHHIVKHASRHDMFYMIGIIDYF